MKRTSHLCTTLLLALVLACFVSCSKNSGGGNQEKKSEDQKKHVTIGFSIDTLAIERWQRDLDVFINKAKELGAQVIVQNAGNSVEEQNRQLMYLCDCNVDVIVVVAKKADSLGDTITKIRSKNIPVISYDRLIRDTEVDLYMSINSKSVGELMAAGLMERTVQNHWICILGPEEDYNMSLIRQGITEKIRKTIYTVDNVYYTEGWNYDLSYQYMANLIAKGKLPDAIICGNDAVASSVIQALTDYSQKRKIFICGQDADISACQYIVDGKQDFTIYKPITHLAELAAEYALRIGNGESVESITKNLPTINNGVQDVPVLWLEPTLVDKNNMESVIIESGFHTNGEVYK